MRDIYKIIETHFERDYFSDVASTKTEKNINLLIEQFEHSNPDITKTIFLNLKSSFPNAKIENWTQFFNGDRCIRYLIEIDETQRFICQISIFGYFSIYQHSYCLTDKGYDFSEIVFLNRYESEICDKAYECTCLPAFAPIWLDRSVLVHIVPELSVDLGDELFNNDVTIADVLFTNHTI